MKRFQAFGEYMTDLLFGPLKKGAEKSNQLRIFFKVIGRELDDIKKIVFRVRDEANVASASPVMLQVHGQDRNMPRLAGENVEAYRTRLSMKGIISEWSGTKRGVLYALTALGYDKSAIEPFALQDPSRWAEFIIYLDGSKQSGINNLLAIDTEVQKVKEGSSKPAYGTKASCTIEIRTKVEARASWYPRCGETVCGVFPHMVNIGYIAEQEINVGTSAYEGDVKFPKAGEATTSEKFYQASDYVIYDGVGSRLTTTPRTVDGVNEYEKCSTKTYLKGDSD